MKRIRRWLGCLALVPALAAGLVDEHIVMPGGIELQATFNQPGFGGDVSTRLEDRIVELISLASPGSEIRVSMYTFRRPNTAVALLEARDRGVNVRVIVDRKSFRGGSPALDLLRRGGEGFAPLDGCDDGPCVKVCRFGCQGLHINHNKFVLLSALDDGSRWVVAQTSANLTAAQLGHYNDLLVIRNDRSLYRAFTDYFDDLGQRRWAPRPFRRARGDSPIEAFFFPRPFGPDPIAAMLERVSCTGDSVIRVAHSRFESFRGGVARQLKALSEAGCDVQVLLRQEPALRSPGVAVLEALDELTTVLPYRGDEPARNAIHTKLILIRAPIGESEEPRHFVLTGSHNLSITSLRLNDEVLLRIESEELFDSYWDFWNGILEDHQAR